MIALELERVSYTYPGSAAPALSDLTLSVAAGELCVLAGMSASGKSTLLRLASGLVPHFYGGAFAGRAAVCGLELRDSGPEEIATVAGTLFGDPETQIVMGTVRAELELPLENRGLRDAEIARGVEEVALALGIENLLERTTRELSGGERQRVALGAALVGRPRLVVLDEPTSQLDPVAGDELIWLVRRLNEDWGTTVLLAEHRLERCLGAADRVIALAGGRIACDSPPRDFLDWAADAAPALQTPGARLLAGAGLRPPPAGVKDARLTLRAHNLLDESDFAGRPDSEPPARRRRRRSRREDAALAFLDVWHEIDRGPQILRGVSLRIAPGERIALMGRNGAGKSTLLRHGAGLLEPTRGRVERAGRVALLLQDPGAYLIAERVGDELAPERLVAAGLGALADRNPRDLSGGERQRLALAIVTAGSEPPAVICLDEPTRGMDRTAKEDLAVWLRAQERSAVIVATHDPELAARVADRVVLLAAGRVIADAPARELLAGGWYFATETARVLGGREGVLLPEEGAALLRRRMAVEVAS